MTNEEKRAVFEETVSHPGKFEGEPAYTPYFYEQSLDGCFEVIGDEPSIFYTEISADDVAIFPELTVGTFAVIEESESGFVSCEICTAERIKEIEDMADEESDESARVSCDQCTMLAINGVACHEIGCPNMGARWNEESQTWIKQRECVMVGRELRGADLNMDPNENLSQQIELALQIIRCMHDPECECTYKGDELAQLIIAMNDQIANGGFLPDKWRGQ